MWDTIDIHNCILNIEFLKNQEMIVEMWQHSQSSQGT